MQSRDKSFLLRETVKLLDQENKISSEEIQQKIIVNIKEIIKQSNDQLSFIAKTRDQNKQTVLELSIKKGYINVVDMLLKAGIHPSKEENNAIFSALEKCVSNEDLEVGALKKWQVCLSAHFNKFINKKNASGHTLLDIAAQHVNLPVCQSLLEAKANPDHRSVLSRLGLSKKEWNYNEQLSLSVIGRVSVNDFKKIEQILEENKEILTVAGPEGRVEDAIFNQLLQCIKKHDNASFNQWKKCLGVLFSEFFLKKDNKGKTLLHWAGHSGNLEIADILIQVGASSYTVCHKGMDYHGYLNSYIANEGNATKILSFLESKESKNIISTVCKKGSLTERVVWAALMKCIKNGHTTKFKQWWNCLGSYIGPFAFRQNKDGETLLHHAARNGSIEIADILLKAGASTKMCCKRNLDYYDNLSIGIIRSANDEQKIKSILKAEGYIKNSWIRPNHYFMLHYLKNEGSVAETICSKYVSKCVKNGDAIALKQWIDLLGCYFGHYIVHIKDIKNGQTLFERACSYGNLKIACMLAEAGFVADSRLVHNDYYDSLILCICQLFKNKNFAKLKSIIIESNSNLTLNTAVKSIISNYLAECIKNGDMSTVKQCQHHFGELFMDIQNKLEALQSKNPKGLKMFDHRMDHLERSSLPISERLIQAHNIERSNNPRWRLMEKRKQEEFEMTLVEMDEIEEARNSIAGYACY